MIMSAVLAVALGVTPINESGAPQLVSYDEAKVAAQVGRYKQRVHKDGSTEVRGVDRLGRVYDLTIAGNGHVTGHVGDWYVTFDVKDAA